MKLPLGWINDYTDIKDTKPHEFAEAMTMSGSKVEGVEEMGADIQNVVAGKILKMEKHKNADTLWVCQVSVGDETIQVVTGAQNVKEGDLVPVAKSGALLPGGIKIKAGKLRGEESKGMLCSHAELGLELSDYPGAHEDGILIFEDDYAPGTDVKKILGLSDSVIEFEITSNRPDCLSVIGLAREAAATYGRPFKIPEVKVSGGGGRAEDYIKVSVEAPDLCPRYTARVVRNVKIGPSPKWLRDRLTACGVRPINNIVDITNYVMLEYGQPMHAFDREYLKGGEIVVRRARDGEEITTLDGIKRTLAGSMLVIADGERAVAVAGVMGGENSEISESTKNIVFESASFEKTSVRLTSKGLGLRTESSSRFEKGLDSELTLLAINRACELVEMLGAGEVADGIIDVRNDKRERKTLPFEPEKINRLLGTQIDTDFMVKTLRSLDFYVDTDNMQITCPTYREDVLGFADIAEEVARIYGYNNIPSTPMSGAATVGLLTFEQEIKERICNTLSMLGCYEVVTYSFTHPKSLAMIERENELEGCIRISNPLGEENSIMRNNMLHSMLEVLATNQNQRNQNIRIFEIGTVYKAEELPLTALPREEKVLAVAGCEGMDFYDLKGLIEELFTVLKVFDYEFRPESQNPSYHPGAAAAVWVGGQCAGIIGEVHPDVLDRYSIDGAAYVAELAFDKILAGVNKSVKYKQLNRYPAVSRDIAVLIDDHVLAADVEKVIRKYAGKTLEELKLFDVYKGKQIPEGKKSMAYSATFRAADKTLNESDVNKTMEKILTMLSKELGAELR